MNPSFCPKCGKEFFDDAEYCAKCGYNFKNIKTPHDEKSYQDPFDNIGSTGRNSSDPLDGLGTLHGASRNGKELEIGEVFSARYEILSKGMRGGMGVVYKCRDKKLGSVKALKIIHPNLLNSDEAVKRFRQEVAISQSLYHKNIVRVYDIDEHEGIEFFTMEWVEGKSLRDIIVERKEKKGPFTLAETHEIISQLADALRYAHKTTVHRDIKPENILIFKDDEGTQVKLTDFGIAKMLTPSQFLSSTGKIGTPYYMAPEQKGEAAHVDKRADIYAVGVVLFELLILENTIGLEMPSEINKALPKGIDEIVKKSLANKPEDRYKDVKELKGELDSLILGGRFGEKHPQKNIKAGPASKNVSIGVVVLSVILILGIIYLTSFKKETAPTLKESMQTSNSRATIEKVKPGKEEVTSVKGTEKELVNKRVDELKTLVNHGLTTHPGKSNVAMIIESPKSEGGSTPETALYRLLKTDKVHVVVNLFKEELFKSKGFFKEIYDGNTDLLIQTDALSKIDFMILGRLSYSFRKGSEIDRDLVSCDINLSYKVINKKGEIINSDNIHTLGPGFSEEAALSRGLGIIAERYSDRILKSFL